MSVLKEVYQWQVDAGNASRDYDDLLEASFQVEEAIEGFSDVKGLAFALDVDRDLPKLEKEVSRAVVTLAQGVDVKPVEDIERLDKALDAIVFAVGSIAKLDLTAGQMERALSVVNNANKQKLGCPRDEKGKLIKPTDFVEPQPELEKILAERI